MAAVSDVLNQPVVSASLRIQRTKERRGNGGGGGGAMHEKIEEKKAYEGQSIICRELPTHLRLLPVRHFGV